jgi:hypothetical protein
LALTLGLRKTLNQGKICLIAHDHNIVIRM